MLQSRRDRSDFWEGIKAHNATVTCAIFAPHPEAIIKPEIDEDDIAGVNVSYTIMPKCSVGFIDTRILSIYIR